MLNLPGKGKKLSPLLRDFAAVGNSLAQINVARRVLDRNRADLDTLKISAVLLCLDEFDKLIGNVADGKLSRDVLGLLRGLSQARGWMVLYSGQCELDNFSVQFAEYLKNVRRVRVSYLKADEARDLLTNPVPDFALTWEAEAVERALH